VKGLKVRRSKEIGKHCLLILGKSLVKGDGKENQRPAPYALPFHPLAVP
jgi:hypothetical protein